MSVVMVVEDEHMLRSYTVRALRRLPHVEVVEAATYEEAAENLQRYRPSLMVSDIGLPDQNALGLLTELDAAGMQIPIIFVSAYLGEYRDYIPHRPGIEVFEKPVSMSVLSETVQRLLEESRSARRAPFSVTEYLQLASMGKHSVVVRVVRDSEQLGWARICRGDLWAAQAGPHTGIAAVRTLVFATEAKVEVEVFDGPAGPRQIHRPLEAILLDAFRAQDEALRRGLADDIEAGIDALQAPPSKAPRSRRPLARPPMPALPGRESRRSAFGDSKGTLDKKLPSLSRPPSQAPPPPPPPEPPPEPDDGFAALMEEGLDALLLRDYHLAWRAFAKAEKLRADHPVVRANLARIRQMGHAPDEF